MLIRIALLFPWILLPLLALPSNATVNNATVNKATVNKAREALPKTAEPEEAPYPPPIKKKLIGGIVPVDRYKGEDYQVVDIKTLKQPPELAASIKAMTEGTLEQRIAALKTKTLRDLAFLKGGRFWMGDFGPWHNDERLPYTGQSDNKPFEVELDGYSIGKYKVTYAEFDVYTDAVKKARVAMSELNLPDHRPGNPAGVSWYDAKAYCQWLAKLIGLPIDLPTEAQWEYAARSGGQFILYPTDNGQLEMGRNVPNHYQCRDLQPPHPVFGQSGFAPYTVGLFPPSLMGLYDMAHNGREWVEDWYAPYPGSPKAPMKNPRGPHEGDKKVQRCQPNQDSYAGSTLERRQRVSVEKPWEEDGQRLSDGHVNDSFRVVVNAPQPVQAK